MSNLILYTFKYLDRENAKCLVGCIHAPFAKFAAERRLPLLNTRCVVRSLSEALFAPYEILSSCKLTMEMLNSFDLSCLKGEWQTYES
jgi:hypothetical protein